MREHYHRTCERSRQHVLHGLSYSRKSTYICLIPCVWVPATAVWLLHGWTFSTALRHTVIMLLRARAFCGSLPVEECANILVVTHNSIQGPGQGPVLPLSLSYELSTAIVTFLMLPHTINFLTFYSGCYFTKNSFHVCPGHAWWFPIIDLF